VWQTKPEREQKEVMREVVKAYGENFRHMSRLSGATAVGATILSQTLGRGVQGPPRKVAR
jgi:hypothetical protein